MAERLRVLAIDGGGIRGIIPSRVLAELEERSGRPVFELFDLIAGTSTGGLLALGLTKPRPSGGAQYTARELFDLYFEDGPRIFQRSLLRRIVTADGILEERYSDDGLNDVLEQRLGESRLTDSLTEVLITAYAIDSRKPFFFKSAAAREEPGRDAPIRDAARATSAAPAYFEPHEVPSGPAGTGREAEDSGGSDVGSGVLIDGGVFAVNPAMCAYAEVRRHYPTAEIVLASLGTGSHTRPIEKPRADRWGALGWAPRILDIVFDGVATATNYQLEHVLREGYYRFDIKLGPGMGSDDLDDASRENLAKLRSTAELVVERDSARIDALLARL